MANAGDLDFVRKVLGRHREEILKSYDAAGVGIGAAEGREGQYAIVVYLKSADKRPNTPVLIEGISLRFVVTGEFKPYK